jgi:GNAT superfamily N-acetyltransferase
MTDLATLMSKLDAARALVNPCKGLGPYMEIRIDHDDDDDGLEVPVLVFEVQYVPSPLPPESLEGCMDLFQKNMADLYRRSNWGLDLDGKRKEMNHEHARFLLVRDQEGELVAFLHFRFDVNDDDEPTEEVLYIYELQIARNYTGMGIGRRLVAITELVALRTDMKKVMLTVFKANADAYRFYTKRMNYHIDPMSPSQHGEEADYEILSKKDLMKAA